MSKLISSEVKAQVVNTKKEFKWRLVCGKERGHWSTRYEGIYVHTFSNGERWYYASAYWDGVLPIEQPFQIAPAWCIIGGQA